MNLFLAAHRHVISKMSNPTQFDYTFIKCPQKAYEYDFHLNQAWPGLLCGLDSL